jgi:hypothetical protein
MEIELNVVQFQFDFNSELHLNTFIKFKVIGVCWGGMDDGEFKSKTLQWLFIAT